MTATLAPHDTECSNCHQVDNHVKHHYGESRFHFDCLPDDVRADSFDHLPPAERERIDTVIAHATGDGAEHLHGHDLRVKHIELDPNQPAHVKQAVGVTVPARRAASANAKGKTRG